MSSLTQKLKRTIGKPIIKIIQIKVFNRHIFLNRYTRNIPGLRWIIARVDALTTTAHTRKQLEKEYSQWFKSHYPSAEELKTQISKQRKFRTRPLISLIVPTYNTNIQHLEECIQSVQAQSYENWELCIADDASTNPQIRGVIEEYAGNDARIRFIFREENGHICHASNSAIKLANGEFIALLDHDDVLWPNALYEVVKTINQYPRADFIYTDEDKISEYGNIHSEPFFKPDWSFEFLRSINYITHFSVLRRSLVRKVGGFRPGYEGAQDWDLFLRLTRETDNIHHIPTVLYSWRKSATSTAQAPSAKDYAYINQKKALEDDVKSRNMQAEISWQIPFSMWKVAYKTKDPLVSIVIPTKNQFEYIARCLRSIKEKTTYKNFEIIIVDTGTTEQEVWDLYKSSKGISKRLKVARWKEPFNFAAVCNYGAEFAKGEHLLFLNNDTEVISPDWIQDMVAYSQQEEVGTVGCKLYYPDRRLQHAGIILGVGGQNGTPGIAGHFFPAYIDTPPQSPLQQLYIGGTRDFTAVTAACVMVETKKFHEVRGFDPVFKIAFNDVDFCLKLYDKGYRNVYLPHVTLFHYESISVGQPGSKQRDLNVFDKEIKLMLKKWKPLIESDPFYHPEFRRDIANARLRQ